jgi:WD40 repeat protein
VSPLLAASNRLTQSGAIVGTPAYMAPEQARAEEVDGRADLFSLGCVLYQMCTGERPFKGKDTVSTLYALATEQPAPPSEKNPEVTAELNALILRLLAKEREERPASAREVAEALRAMEDERTLPMGEALPLALPAADVPVAVPAYGVPVAEPVAVSAPAVPVPRRGRRWWMIAAPLVLCAGLVPLGLHFTSKGDKVAESQGSPRAIEKALKQAGEAWVPQALVQRPTRIPGLKSWTLATRGHRAPRGYAGLATALRPDGRWLATGGPDGAIRIWDAETGELQRILLDARAGVDYPAAQYGSTLVWSPDGKLLAALVRNHTLRLWDVSTGHSRVLAEGVDGQTLSWSFDGKFIAASLYSKEVKIWEVAPGEVLGSIKHPQGEFCRSFAWSPDAKLLATFHNNDSSLYLWNTQTCKQIKKLEWKIQNPLAPAWSTDGKKLAAVSGQSIFVGEVEDANSVRELSRETKDLLPAYRLYWSPDSTTLLSCHDGDMVRLWDMKAEKLLQVLPHQGGWTAFAAVFWAPDSSRVTTVDIYGVIRRWRVSTGILLSTVDQVRKENQPGVIRAHWSPDGKTLVTGDEESQVRLWDVENGRHRETLPMPADLIPYTTWSPDSRKFIVFPGDGQAQIWQLKPFQAIHKLPLSRRLAWAPDSRRLAGSGREPSQVQVWNTDTGKPICTLEEKGWVPLGAWSITEDQLAFIRIDEKTAQRGGDGVYYSTSLWTADPMTGKTIARPPALGSLVMWEAHLSPNRKILASGSWSADAASLWDAATGKHIRQLPVPYWIHAGLIFWSPDGNKLAINLTEGGGGGPASVGIWGLAEERLLHRIPGISGAVASFGWSSDSRTLMVSDCSGRICFWDANTVRPQGLLLYLKENAYLILSPEGHYRGSPGVEKHLVYVTLRDDGSSETLSPAEFAEKYGWKNDPDKVRLLAK